MSILSDTAQLATAVGVFFVAGQVQAARTTQRAAFEQKFADRYYQIMDRIPIDHRLQRTAEWKANEQEYYDYFLLCEEEIYYRKQSRVSRSTWLDWWAGIRVHLSQETFRSAWDDLRTETDFFHELGKAIAYDRSEATESDKACYDPSGPPKALRWSRSHRMSR